MNDITSFLTAEGTPERCGVITRDGEVLELSNIAVDPIAGFRFDPSEVVIHFSDALATWHTHPGADPNLSDADYAGFLQWPDLDHLIVGHRRGQPVTIRYQVIDDVVVMA